MERGNNSKCCESRETRKLRENLVSQTIKLKNDIYDLSRKYNLRVSSRFYELESVLERTEDFFVLQTIYREFHALMSELMELTNRIDEELKFRERRF